MWKRSVPLAAIACWVISISATDSGLRRYQIAGYAQGTDYTITYYAEDRVVSKEAVDSILVVIDSSMSLYKPYSLINKINGGNGEEVMVDEHFYRVLKRSFEIYRDSRGVFDLTVAPLVQLWGFGVEAISHFPDSAAIHDALACVGMDMIRLKGRRLTKKKPCIKLDMNGVAQGYSVDVLADHLERNGIIHYIVELGGELRVRGPKPDGEPMRIGIERPARNGDEHVVIQDVITVRIGAITTAGNYRKFLQEGTRRVSHHIDPKTGYPFDKGIISATIYAKDAITADGYDNVIMAMKADEAITFANKRKDMDVFLVYRDGTGAIRDTMSVGFKKLIN